MEGVEWTQVRWTHSGTQGKPFNIGLNVNNEIQDCETGAVLGQ
jgi:hypothetical protein